MSPPPPRSPLFPYTTLFRSWLPPGGQRWTTLAELAAAGHASDVRAVEAGLTGIGADPPVAIGQRSLLVTTPAGNILWDPSGRSEEHTSELQSRRDLVCRLLL